MHFLLMLLVVIILLCVIIALIQEGHGGMVAVAVVAALVLCTCTGCAALKPVSIPIEYTHVSHLTQHFDSGKSDYGYNSVSVGLKWKLDPHLTVVLSEGLVLDKEHYYGDNTKACGSLGGGREVFTGRVTYEIPLR